MTNDELRIGNWKSAVRLFVILCALFVFTAESFFGQERTLPQVEIDFSERQIRLARLIADGTTEQKRDALSQIRNLEIAEASRIAVPALRDRSEIVRATAAASVVSLPPDEAARNLLPLLADRKPFVRREAAYAIGKVGDASAVNSLLQIVRKDKIVEVRGAAIIALGAIGDASAVSEITKVLRRKSEAKEEFLRRSAARAIGQIAQKLVRTERTEVITPENFLPDRYKTIAQPDRAELIEAFPSYQTAVVVLIETLGNAREFPDVRREAAFALGAIGDRAAIPVLQANLRDADYYLAEICRESLRKIRI